MKYSLLVCVLSFSILPASAQEITGRDERRLVDPQGPVKPVREPVVRRSGLRQRTAAPESGGNEPGGVHAFRKVSALEGRFTGDLDDADRFGTSVVALGDLDGNGVGDLAVGALRDDDGGTDVGAVWILFLNAEGAVASQQKISATRGGFTGALGEGDRFGASVASLGDVDGDQVVDLAVGAYGAQRVWILFLDQDGTVKSHRFIDGGTPTTTFGRSVASIGDLDGDGIRELIVGDDSQPGGSQGMPTGAVHLYSLDATGTVKASRQIEFGEPGPNDTFGWSAASLGDLDLDGVEDLAIGATHDHDGGVIVGAVWILFLNPDGSVKAHQKISATNGGFGGDLELQDRFGSSLAPMGDLDGDGVVDLAVGAARDDEGGQNLGVVWILYLNRDGTVRTQRRIGLGLMDDSPSIQDLFGVSAAALRDIDGDGLHELVVGAVGDDDGGTDIGALWILSLDGIATLDFETEDDLETPLVNGQGIASPDEFGTLVNINGVGPNNYGAAIFDSDAGGPNAASSDPDLLVDLGNVLLLQENQHQSVPGIFDTPDDAQLGGMLVFDFLEPARMVSVDLIDICPGAPVQDVAVTLFDGAMGMRTYAVPGGWTSDRFFDGPPGYGTLTLDTLEPQEGFVATATAVETDGFDPNDVVRMEVALSSSGALDNVRFDPHPDAGEPQTVSINPSRDNTLIQHSDGALSNGAGFQIFTGRVGLMGGGRFRRGVIAFDVSGAVPAGATITGASLTMHLSLTNTGAHDVSLHPLLKDWGEGTSASGGGAGASSTSGDATWIHTFYPTGFWDTPGGDFAPKPVATTNVSVPEFYTWSSAGLVASVQAWLDDPATNFGWAIIGDESFFQTAQGFDSRENSDSTERPVLTIEF
jgi:hypothetical protein